MPATIRDTVIVHKDPFAYISHPSVTVLKNGDFLAAYNHSVRREKRLHPPADPLFRTLVCRSRDHGATWDRPEFAPDFDSYGTECPGIECLKDGTVLLTEFRFAWYPLGLARKKRRAGERVALQVPGKGWTEEIEEGDWAKSEHPWARGRHGVYVHRSEDGGAAFDETVKIETEPYEHGYSRTGVEELSDGRIAYALTEHQPRCGKRRTYLVFSDDGGRSWGAPAPMVEEPENPFGEPDIVETAPGEILCVLRDSSVTKYLYACRSEDGGRTWSAPERTEMYGFPGQLLKLADGRILCTYGLRQPPFGVRACLSEDGGRTWLLRDEIVLRDDLPNSDLGYPTTVEYAPGRLFCIYYGQTPDGVTCVQGTWFEVA